ncbi:hypothetical protein THASP1DRAFT_20297, partial [Thamnocephalis sphaerospora]
SNAHYVGYVEDGESVEAIMKKFEELERLQAEFAAAASGLTQEQLEEVFKRTSAFTVRAAVRLTHEDVDAMDEIDLWRMEMDGGDGAVFDEEDDYVFMDEDYWDEVFGPAALARRPRMPRRITSGAGTGGSRSAQGSDRESVIQRYRTMQVRVQDQQGNYHLVKKKVSTLDPSLPTYIRIPGPIPATWAQRICTLTRSHCIVHPARHFTLDNMIECAPSLVGDQYQAIYMDPPLLLPGEAPTAGKLSMEEFATLQVPRLIRCGFLFIWAEKQLLARVVQVAMNWGFKYVENFCWIKKTPDNRIVQQSSAHFSRSKATLLIFRRGGEIDLRHQRNPDCVFDFIKPPRPGDLTEEKPNFTYTMIETMLPAACYQESDAESGTEGARLLELWARPLPRFRRRGWTSVAQR